LGTICNHKCSNYCI